MNHRRHHLCLALLVAALVLAAGERRPAPVYAQPGPFTVTPQTQTIPIDGSTVGQVYARCERRDADHCPVGTLTFTVSGPALISSVYDPHASTPTYSPSYDPRAATTSVSYPNMCAGSSVTVRGTGVTGTATVSVSCGSISYGTATIMLVGSRAPVPAGSPTAGGGTQNGARITTAALPDCGLGEPCLRQVMATGGQPPYTWNVSGALPPGLQFDGSLGLLFGVPTQLGAYTLNVSVRDGRATAAALTYSGVRQAGGTMIPLVVAPPPVLPAGSIMQIVGTLHFANPDDPSRLDLVGAPALGVTTVAYAGGSTICGATASGTLPAGFSSSDGDPSDFVLAVVGGSAMPACGSADVSDGNNNPDLRFAAGDGTAVCPIDGASYRFTPGAIVQGAFILGGNC